MMLTFSFTYIYVGKVNNNLHSNYRQDTMIYCYYKIYIATVSSSYNIHYFSLKEISMKKSKNNHIRFYLIALYVRPCMHIIMICIMCCILCYCTPVICYFHPVFDLHSILELFVCITQPKQQKNHNISDRKYKICVDCLCDLTKNGQIYFMLTFESHSFLLFH